MKKISPCLWFNNQAEEAAKFYTGVFSRSSLTGSARNLPGAPKGVEVLTSAFELDGLSFIALNGGPIFTFNPSISLFVSCETETEIDRLFKSLSEGGVLMPLQKYPFSEKYGWVKDRYGLSWQLNLTKSAMIINPLLMFTGPVAGKAEEAMRFYTSVFPRSDIGQTAYYDGENGTRKEDVVHAVFNLNGQQFMAMDSRLEHDFNFNEAVSLTVYCETQQEVDYYWDKLSAGGKEVECGWLRDRYGVFWQIVPVVLPALLTGPDHDRAARVMQAMMKMVKLDIATLEEA